MSLARLTPCSVTRSGVCAIETENPHAETNLPMGRRDQGATKTFFGLDATCIRPWYFVVLEHAGDAEFGLVKDSVVD